MMVYIGTWDNPWCFKSSTLCSSMQLGMRTSYLKMRDAKMGLYGLQLRLRIIHGVLKALCYAQACNYELGQAY